MAASALAAVSAAVISSTFGVAGTLIGAAIASIVASVGSTLYLASLHTTNERLRRMAVAARRADLSAGAPTRPVSPEAAAAVHEPELPFPAALGSVSEGIAEATGGIGAADVIDAERRSGWNRVRWTNLRRGMPALRRRWVAVAGLAVLVFAITVGVLTAVGASTKQSAFPLGGSGGSGKSPTAPASSPAKATGSPTPAPSASPSSTGSPTATATPSASASSSASPAPGASSPAPSPSATPSAGATGSPNPTPATVP